MAAGDFNRGNMTCPFKQGDRIRLTPKGAFHMAAREGAEAVVCGLPSGLPYINIRWDAQDERRRNQQDGEYDWKDFEACCTHYTPLEQQVRDYCRRELGR